MLIELGDIRCAFRPWLPSTGRVFVPSKPPALDIETTLIVGHEVPEYVLGAASDGERGVFLARDHVRAFLEAHPDCPIVLHNCAFDLAVTQSLLQKQGKPMDVYERLDNGLVWDVMLLHKLHGLATLGHTHQGKGRSTLERCAETHLGVELPKDAKDRDGDDIRTSWAKWLGRPPKDIHAECLDYLAKDVLATIGCFQRLMPGIREALGAADGAFGHAGGEWLASRIERYGPQTHHIQAMGSVALVEIERAGFGVDLAGRDETLRQARTLLDGLREELRGHGYLEGEKGCDKALQSLVRKAVKDNPGIEVPLTRTGKFSTTEEDLDRLAGASPFFAALKEFRQARSFVKNWLEKMGTARIHPHYDCLKDSGRTGSSGPNIQGFPQKAKKKGKLGLDIRRSFAPAPGKILYVADYNSVELRTLAQALKAQFGLESKMAEALNSGQDLHRLVAARMKATSLPDGAAVLADPARFAELAASVTSEERSGAKPANFGLPVGMGVKTLKGYASANYGQAYTDEDAKGWKDAWLATFPEMESYLDPDVDIAQALAERLGLTPLGLSAATGRPADGWADEDVKPAAWLGGMALKVLLHPSPKTRKGEEYGPDAMAYLWDGLQRLAPDLEDEEARWSLEARRPGPGLLYEVKRLVNRSGVFTLTGRLRAGASYSARRNNVFQGLAADGAKLALYRLLRAGFRVVAFIHDEVVIEVDADADLRAVKERIDAILVEAMKEVCPDIKIEVEGSFRRRWGKDEADKIELPARA